MIDLISARGNTSLESAVSLTKSLRWEIQALGQRLASAANSEELVRRKGSKAQDKIQHETELKRIVQAIRKLLTRIEDAVPLINLAITASGASLSSNLPSTVSPSRLLQASTFLTAGDSQYGASSSNYVQIGPTFSLSMYMLFLGHVRPQNEEEIRESTWKEVIHKANVRLMRVSIEALYDLPGTDRIATSARNTNGERGPFDDSESEHSDYFPQQMDGAVKTDEYAYQLVIVEDLDDDRVHTFDGDPQPGPYGDIPLAGIREAVPIHELSKIFYADTGKILNIGSEGEANSPVLLLKRDPNAVPPRMMMNRYNEEDGQGYNEGDTNGCAQFSAANSPDNSRALVASSQRGLRSSSAASTQSQDQQVARAPDPWRLPPDLDPEWIAFEVYTESEDSDTESEVGTSSSRPAPSSRDPPSEPKIASALSRLSVSTPTTSSPSPQPPTPPIQHQVQPTLPPIRTSLSLLETLLRLLSLQQFQQTPHLSIPDELLAFFLSESASTGAASNDIQERKRLRDEARRRVGFDPYDESPIKRRGEEYQYHGREGTPLWNGEGGHGSERGYESEERYQSPRHDDEGYDTRNWTYSSHEGRSPSTPRESIPQTPPMLLKNRSRSGTPDKSPSSPGGRYAAPKRWHNGRGNLRQGDADAARRGSPLARPGTGATDEGLGTSPASEEEKKDETWKG
ncbi:RanGTP-binding protein-domain-containing protein [Usnea florida]